MKKKHLVLSTTQITIMSFLLAILIGSVILTLPISFVDGKEVSFIDALFTATTSVCVTGLVTLTPVETWSVFGQIVILILIQIGGLGIITVMSMVMILLQKKLGLGERILLQDSFNLNSISEITNFVRRVVTGTFIVELTGALLYMTIFVPRFGVRGIWISLFNSVSAFCNAGLDIIPQGGVADFATNPIFTVTTCALIVLGGIGFIVWWDFLNVLKNVRRRGVRAFSGLTLHSKIALSVTAFLITIGTVLFFVLEYNNPSTMKGFSVFDKLQMSLFQSVTTRTAGFSTIDQKGLTNASAFISMILMFVGGSPVGTAGGIKTVTIAVLFATMRSAIKNRKEISAFGRTIPRQTVMKAVAVTGISFMTVFVSTILLSITTNADALDILFETISATTTVGLSRNFTSSDLVGMWAKLILIATMYIGRIGPISLVIAFAVKRKNENIIKNPVEEISVG